MRSVLRLVTFVAFAIVVAIYVGAPGERAAIARAPSENAYRANNVGVAHLEQFDYPAAARSFRRALQIAPDLTMARVNLAIALYYAGDLLGARREAEAASKTDTTLLQAHYVLGLVARAENRTAEAVEAFARVLRADPDDLGSAINLGQVYVQQQKFAEAVELFRRAVRLEPYQATAAYGLATALLRSGAREEGTAAMSRFQELRSTGYATSYSQNYLEQGRYAAAIASTGAEPELVDTTVPDVRFADATSEAFPAAGSREGTGLGLFDLDADGDLDLALASADGLRLFSNERGRFSDVTARSGAALAGTVTRAIAGDYDNDDRVDLFLLSPDRNRLLHREADGTFADVTATAGIAGPGSTSAAWADVDHDGDLDLVAPPRLLRNNGNGTFADVSAAAHMPATAATAVAPTDFDNRRDLDLVIASSGRPPILLRNLRDGSFRDAAEETRLASAGSVASVAMGDINKDGFIDFFFGRSEGTGRFATSDGRGQFKVSDADPSTRGSRAALLLDYDNDGLLDLVTLSGGPTPTVLRNIGAGWTDATARAFSGAAAGTGNADQGELAAGDLDGDGDTDLVVGQRGGVRVWRNEGGNRHPSLRVRLSARVSNHSAAGAKVEMRAGSLTQQLETAIASPAVVPADVLFGLGDRGRADAVRILWPAGILQAEVEGEKPLRGELPVLELDRKPSSCPYLYTWNGERFEFVTDFLGGGEMGYWVAPGVRSTPDPDEYVRIESRQLQPRDGRYELRVTNELEEALFLDRVQLVAVTHPEGTEVYPNEGMGERPKSFALHATHDARPPLAAVDEHGHDVLDRVSTMDRTYPDDFALEPVRGYAKRHALTLTLPPRLPGERVLLLLTGWTDYAFSRDNVAASQSELRLEPPSLAVRDEAGAWRTVISDIGVPVGRPQTVPVELTSVLPAGATEVRIETTMRIYWDRVLVGTDAGQASGFRLQASGKGSGFRVQGSGNTENTEAASRTAKGGQSPFSAGNLEKRGTVPLSLTRLDPVAATLRWRGFSAETSPDGREPFGYDYARVSASSPWKLMPGRYTREGDVRPLLLAADDMFVVSRPGDEVALSFDARALPPAPPGWTRTFLLYAAGFSKEMDPHSSSPDQLAPLPFHGMTRYPYLPPERYPDDPAHRDYVERYNTRIVSGPLPRIELAAPSTQPKR